MKNLKRTFAISVMMLFLSGGISLAQQSDPVVDRITEEATENSQLERLAHELLDVVGPRLVGTTQMQNAHNWAVETFESWGIPARNEEWGDWRGWERGITHVDLISPRVVSLEGMQLAWSPPTPEGGVTAEVVTLPTVQDSTEFREWLSGINGKFVLISMNQPTGRPDYNWQEYGTEESIQKMRDDRSALTRECGGKT